MSAWRRVSNVKPKRGATPAEPLVDALLPDGERSSATHHRIAQLDGWRGISILLVVLGHLVTWRYPYFPPDDDRVLVSRLLSDWGVYFFFVISGFIITKLALTDQRDRGKFLVKSFYVRRFFRIVPPFFTYLAFTLAATYAGLIANSPSQTLVAATFMCNMSWTDCGWFAGHTWTLAYEEQFYLLFPILFWIGRHRIRPLLLGLFVAIILAPLLRRALHLVGGWEDLVSFCKNFVFISLGAVMAAYEPTLKRLSLSSTGGLMNLSVAVGLLAFAFVVSRTDLDGYLAVIQAISRNALVPLSIAWLVGSSIYQENWLTRILRSSPLQFVGMISYSLYLWQQMFTADRLAYTRDSWLLFPPLMVIVATTSYYFIERPCVRLGKRLLSRRGE